MLRSSFAGAVVLILVTATAGCRGIHEMMTPPAVAAAHGPRCKPTPIDPTAEARATLLAVESAYDQYLLLLPFDGDWNIVCSEDPALSGLSRNLQLQATIRVTDWNAGAVRPEEYLDEVRKKSEATYAPLGWRMQDAALVNPFDIPILRFRVQGRDAAGNPFNQYNYVTMRPRADGRIVELTLSLDNPNPSNLSGREGSLYYFLSNFYVKGQAQRMRAVEGKPPKYR